MTLNIVSCQSGPKKEEKYKKYISPDSSYVVSVPEQIHAKYCIADFMSFVKDRKFIIIIRRVPVNYLNDDITKINEEREKVSFSQIEVSDTSILYQAAKGFFIAYKYYLIKKLPTANYMISISSFSDSRNGIKDMGSRIYASLKPYQVKDVLLKADKSYTTSNYSIKYPKEWKVIENIDEETDACIVSETWNTGMIIMRFKTDTSLVEGNADGNEAICQAGARILKEELITFKGVKCYRAVQEIPSKSSSSGFIRCISYSFKKGNMFYNIRVINILTKEQESLAEEIFASFRFK